MDDDRTAAEPGQPDPETVPSDPAPRPPEPVASPHVDAPGPPNASGPGVVASSSPRERRVRGGTFVALALAAILLFGTGSLVGRLSASGAAAGPTASPASSAAPTGSAGPAASGVTPTWSLLDQAYELLRANYVDPSGLDPTTLEQGAIRGLTEAVNDPGHTGYLTPQEVAARDASLSGTFVGVGAVLDLRGNAPTVVRVLPDSPADKAGLRAGEVILRVNGVSVAGQTIEQIVVKVRGPAGTSVTLDLQELDGTERSLTIVRAKLNLPLVSWALAPGSRDAVIRLESFSTGAAKDLVAAIKAARVAGAAGIVLDLRANPGGYVSEAIDVASQFLGSGVVYISQDRSGAQTPHEVAGGGTATNLPLVVLVDGQTASAAEIVTGAIQDAGRATIVGQTTYGTGTVVGTYPLPDGSAVTIGTERWLTPKGQAIWREGLTPDQAVALAQGVNFLVPDDFATLGSGGIGGSSDAQLQAALGSLQVAERAANGG